MIVVIIKNSSLVYLAAHEEFGPDAQGRCGILFIVSNVYCVRKHRPMVICQRIGMFAAVRSGMANIRRGLFLAEQSFLIGGRRSRTQPTSWHRVALQTAAEERRFRVEAEEAQTPHTPQCSLGGETRRRSPT